MTVAGLVAGSTDRQMTVAALEGLLGFRRIVGGEGWDLVVGCNAEVLVIDPAMAPHQRTDGWLAPTVLRTDAPPVPDVVSALHRDPTVVAELPVAPTWSPSAAVDSAKPLDHVALVLPDHHRAAGPVTTWSGLDQDHGLGSWTFPDLGVSNTALMAENWYLELNTPEPGSESVFQATLDRHGPGIAFCCFRVEDLDAAAEEVRVAHDVAVAPAPVRARRGDDEDLRTLADVVVLPRRVAGGLSVFLIDPTWPWTDRKGG